MPRNDRLVRLTKELQDDLLNKWKFIYANHLYNLGKNNTVKIYSNAFHKLKSHKDNNSDREKDYWTIIN